MGRVFEFPYRTVAEISLQALVRNLVTLRLYCGREVIPVVKADAYGHGMVAISKVLLNRADVQMLAVATLEEAMELRQQFNRPFGILVLSAFLPHQLDAYIKFNLTPLVHNLNHLKSLRGVAQLPPIHLKVDTGMNRLGLKSYEMVEALEVLEKASIKLAGLGTHFAESELATSTFIDTQIDEFEFWYRELSSRKILATDARIHMGNSGAVLRKKLSFSNSVRLGLSLYGVSPNPELPIDPVLLPILQWKTRILSTKKILPGETVGYGRTYTAKTEQLLGLISVGYADGFPRSLSNKAEVIINGKRVPVRGRVSMDLVAVELTSVPEARDGHLVTLIGSQNESEITAWEFARWADTIPYEIFCGISPRVSRIYFDSDAT